MLPFTSPLVGEVDARSASGERERERLTIHLPHRHCPLLLACCAAIATGKRIASPPPHPPFGHLLPRGEKGWRPGTAWSKGWPGPMLDFRRSFTTEPKDLMHGRWW